MSLRDSWEGNSELAINMVCVLIKPELSFILFVWIRPLMPGIFPDHTAGIDGFLP